MKTLGTKVNDEVYSIFADSCKQSGVTTSEKLRELIKNKDKLDEPFDMEKAFEHMKNCKGCMYAMLDKGYALLSLKELKKYNLEPVRN
ncbi:MAG: hypothetical protein WAL88_00405 [Nitrosotalea sp.]